MPRSTVLLAAPLALMAGCATAPEPAPTPPPPSPAQARLAAETAIATFEAACLAAEDAARREAWLTAAGYRAALAVRKGQEVATPGRQVWIGPDPAQPLAVTLRPGQADCAVLSPLGDAAAAGQAFDAMMSRHLARIAGAATREETAAEGILLQRSYRIPPAGAGAPAARIELSARPVAEGRPALLIALDHPG